MLKTEFQKIAKEEAATLTIQEEKIDVGGGEKSPNLVFLLTLEYKSRLIRISNATGTYFVGTVLCQVSEPKEFLEFEINTKSHLSSLFTKNKDRFRIKTENENIKSFLRQSVGLGKIRTIAEKTNFDPTIIGRNTTDKFQLTIEYHLEFNNWWEVIKPIIVFNKEFIDRFG